MAKGKGSGGKGGDKKVETAGTVGGSAGAVPTGGKSSDVKPDGGTGGKKSGKKGGGGGKK